MNVSETVKTQNVIVFNSPVFSKIASHMHHAFLYISLPFMNNYEVKLPNFTCYGERKQATTKVIFLFQNLDTVPSGIQLQEGSPTFDKVDA